MATRNLSRSRNPKPQTIVQEFSSHCTLSSKRTVMCDDEWKDGSEPPDKKRKTDQNEEELWGDDEEDDVIFSQMVMDNIEASQNVEVKTKHTGEPNNNNSSGGIKKKTLSLKSNKSDDKGSKFYHPKAIPGDIVSQPLKSEGYGTMTHASASTLTSSFNPQNTLGKGSTSQVSGHPPHEPSSVRDSTGGNPAQKTDSSVFNIITPSTLGKDPALDVPLKSEFADIMQKKIQKLEEENLYFRQHNQKLKEGQYGRDGQIKILRTKVTQLEAERSRDKQEKVKQKEQQMKCQSNKEKKMETELEKLRHDMQFKERDIAELQERCRRMEKQSRAGGDLSPCRSQFQSPAKSPRLMRETRSSPRHFNPQCTSPRTPLRSGTESGGFPNKISFMADGKKYSSPAKKETEKLFKETDGSEEPQKVSKCRNLHLRTRSNKGGLSGPRIVSKLLAGTTNPPSDPVCNIKQSVISLLQFRSPSVDLGVQLERDATTMNFSVTSAAKSKGYLSNDSTSSRESIQSPIIQPENIALAQQGICNLLDNSKMMAQSGTMVTDLHSTSACILLLPLLENYLQNYCELMQCLSESSFTSQSTGLSSDTQSVSDSLGSCSVVKGLVLENASCMNSIENQTLCALLVLEKLVSYSPLVRLVLVCEREFDQLIQEREPVAQTREPVLTAGLGVVSQPQSKVTSAAMETRDEAENGESQTASRTEFHINLSDVLLELDSMCVQVIKQCDMLCKLMKLANPLEFNNKLGNLHLCEASLRILTVLAKSSTSAQLERFENIFTQEALANCVKVSGELSVEQQISLSCTALDLTTQLSRSPFLLSHLCSHEDDCLLLSIYNLCLYLLDITEISHLRALYHKVLDLIIAFLIHHEQGDVKLLESNCACNFEVVRVVSVCLHKELLHYRETPHLLDPSALRTGITVLHALSLRDKLFTRHHAKECRHQYVDLICSFENILKNIPGIEDSELNQVYELWDFDQDYPDSPEDEEMMAEDEQHLQPYSGSGTTMAASAPLLSSTAESTQKLAANSLPAASQAIDVVLLDRD